MARTSQDRQGKEQHEHDVAQAAKDDRLEEERDQVMLAVQFDKVFQHGRSFTVQG
jgi:hypothetical protein